MMVRGMLGALGAFAACSASCGDGPDMPPAPEPAEPSCSLPADAPVIVALDAGFDVTLAVTSDGNLWCWGDDVEGWCNSGDLPYPTMYRENLCLTAVAGGGLAGLRADGTVHLWGFDPLIALPDPYTTTLDDMGAVVQVMASTGSIGFLNSEGEVFFVGSTGDYSNRRNFKGFERLDAPAAVTSLARGFSPCVIASAVVYCLEVNEQGIPYSDLDIDIDNSELRPLTVPEPVRSFSLGNQQACALALSGAVYCVGDYGRPIESSEGPAALFELIPGLPPIDELKLSHTGAIVCGLADGDLWCWGANTFDTYTAGGERAWPPTKVTGIDSVVDFALGLEHLCALRSDHELWCRGWIGAKGVCASDYEWEPVALEYCNAYD
jgi:hypothetical protein